MTWAATTKLKALRIYSLHDGIDYLRKYETLYQSSKIVTPVSEGFPLKKELGATYLLWLLLDL